MNEWLSVPVGPDAAQWVTRGVRRTAVVAVHNVVSGQRLLDVVGLIESDPAVQVVYTRAPDVFHGGVEQFLHTIGALEIPWRQAVHERFDLVLAAAHGRLHELYGPVMVLPHGTGFTKTAHRSCGRDHMVWDGRLVPTSIALSHEAQRDLLARQYPDALDATFVAGDPCYDRLLASARLRSDYRAALDVAGEQRLVVVTSTWGRHSLLSRHQDLLCRLTRQLDPSRYRVVVLAHPAMWFAHGRRQVHAWLANERAAGIRLIEPETDWRAVVVAADFVVGDHGSVTTYAAAMGTPVLRTDLPAEQDDPESPQWYVAATAPMLRLSKQIEPQLEAAAGQRPPDWARTVATKLTSRPGQSHRLVRQEMYRLLGLPAPGKHRAVEPVPIPRFEVGCGHVA